MPDSKDTVTFIDVTPSMGSMIPQWVHHVYRPHFNEQIYSVRQQAKVEEYRNKFGDLVHADFIRQCVEWNWDLFKKSCRDYAPDMQFVCVTTNEIVTSEGRAPGDTWPPIWKIVDNFFGDRWRNWYPSPDLSSEIAKFYPKHVAVELVNYRRKYSGGCGNSNQKQISSNLLDRAFPARVYNKAYDLHNDCFAENNEPVNKAFVVSKHLRYTA